MLLGIRWGSLRTKIIAWSFVPTAIILAAVAWVTFIAYQRVTEDLVVERNQELTRLSTSEFASELTEYTGLLAEYAGLLSGLPATAYAYDGDLVIQRYLLQRAKSRFEVFDGGVIVLDNQGTVVAAEPERLDILGQDLSNRSYFMQRSSRPFFSDIVADGPRGEDVIVVAVPITGDQGQFLGIIAGMFRLGAPTTSPFYRHITRLRIGESGSAYLVDSTGRVIYHSNTERIGEDLSTQDAVQRVLSGEMDALRTRDLHGTKIVASFVPVPGTPWGLVGEETWAALTAGSRGYQQFPLLLLVLGVVVPALVVAVGVRRITKPIADLINAAQQVAGGQFGQTISARTGDEIEELADQFNLMAAQLQESYTHLERRVADRTKELAALNAIAAVVNQSLDLEAILNDALDKTLQVMEVEAGGIYLLGEGAGVLTIAVHRGVSPQFVAGADELKVGEGFSGHVARSGEPLVVRDVSTDPRLTRTVAREEGLHSLASVPLSSKGKVLGTLFAVTHGYREFSEQDIQLLTSIGQQIGMAIENAHLFNAEQRRADQFRVIGQVGRRVTSILAIDELLDQIVQLVQRAFDYDIVEIALVEGDDLVFKARAGRDSDAPFKSFRFRVGEQGITGWVAATGKPLIVPDVRQDPRYVQVTDTDTRSELVVPLKAKEQVIGVLNVQSERISAFDESDLVVLQSLADQAAIVIENARLFKAEQRRAEQFRVISEMGRHITSILDIDELLQEIVRLLRETFGYYLITIGLIEGDKVVFKAGAKTHWPDPQFCPPPVTVGERGITSWVAATGQPLLVPNVRREPRYLLLADAAETRSELAVPMKSKSAVIGVLNVESDRTNAFDESDLTVLQSLAHQAAIAVENVRWYERVQQLAVMEERSRLARDLHDAVTQTLFSASLIAEILPDLWESDQVEGRQLLGELRQLSRGALAEMRTLLLELRPTALVEASLSDLLRQLAEAVTGREGIPVAVTIEGRCDLPPDVHVSLYRIAQEALNNVAKHAQASQVNICLRCATSSESYSEGEEACGERIELCIRDDGRGFDPQNVPPDRLGLGIIRERAQDIGAELRIESTLGAGTQVIVAWNSV
jgi:nitrate/nitrite-specific signal transduction histidine kinase/PAS domain-containing protein